MLALMVLGLAVQPASAQKDFSRVETSRISGATIEQYDRVDPRDLEESADGGFVAKPDARVLREERTCLLDAGAAQRIANALRRARRASERWDGLGADMVIRFEGGDLVAVFEGYREENPRGEMRIYFASEEGWLAKPEQAVIARIAANAGCPFSDDNPKD